MEDMNAASSLLGDTLGGMPVTMLEAGVGARIGSSLMGKALATEAAQPFMTWKAAQYKALDGQLMRGVEGAKTLSLRAAGIESHYYRHGFVPEHVFDEIARRNAGKPDLLKDIERARASNLKIRQEREGRLAPRATENHNGAREVYDAQGKRGRRCFSPKKKDKSQPEIPKSIKLLISPVTYAHIRKMFMAQLN